MTRGAIKELITKYLKQNNYKEITTGWIMTACPFAKWLHPDGDDKRFSFGISTSGGFNCFTCGMKGSLKKLPKYLSRFTHEVPYDMEEFILENIDGEDMFSYTKNYTVYDKTLLNKFEDAPECLSLTKEDIEKWQIKKHNNSLLFPVFDYNNNLVAIKARNINIKSFYFLLNGDIKQFGIWYGQHFKPSKCLALVEGERDAILLSRYIQAWACLGTPTKTQINFIKGVKVNKIILFFDNDDVGRRMCIGVAKELSGLFKLFKVKDYFDCKDPAELVEKNLIKEIKFVRV